MPFQPFLRRHEQPAHIFITIHYFNEKMEDEGFIVRNCSKFFSIAVKSIIDWEFLNPHIDVRENSAWDAFEGTWVPWDSCIQIPSICCCPFMWLPHYASEVSTCDWQSLRRFFFSFPCFLVQHGNRLAFDGWMKHLRSFSRENPLH